MDDTHKHLVDAGDANLMEHRIHTVKKNKKHYKTKTPVFRPAQPFIFYSLCKESYMFRSMTTIIRLTVQNIKVK
jgi:hypothetical protein